MKRLVVLAGVLVGVLGGVAGAQDGADQGAPPEATDPTIGALDSAGVAFDPAIAAELEVKRAPTGHLLVRPRINGQEAGWFIFDTGAGIEVISTPHVERLGLTGAGSVEAVGVGGGENAKLVKAGALALGPMTLTDHVMMVSDLAFLTPHLGEEIVGVIGFGVLSRCIAEMDLSEGRVALHAPDEGALQGLAWTDLVLEGRVPAVRAMFEGHEGVFRLDTGSNGHVTFHQPAVKKWKLIADRELTDTKLGGVGGFVAAKEGTLAWFEIGGLRTEDVPASFAIEAKGTFADTKRDGNIGVELLKPFTLYFDYAGERIAFVKRAE